MAGIHDGLYQTRVDIQTAQADKDWIARSLGRDQRVVINEVNPNDTNWSGAVNSGLIQLTGLDVKKHFDQIGDLHLQVDPLINAGRYDDARALINQAAGVFAGTTGAKQVKEYGERVEEAIDETENFKGAWAGINSYVTSGNLDQAINATDLLLNKYGADSPRGKQLTELRTELEENQRFSQDLDTIMTYSFDNPEKSRDLLRQLISGHPDNDGYRAMAAQALSLIHI